MVCYLIPTEHPWHRNLFVQVIQEFEDRSVQSPSLRKTMHAQPVHNWPIIIPLGRKLPERLNPEDEPMQVYITTAQNLVECSPNIPVPIGSRTTGQGLHIDFEFNQHRDESIKGRDNVDIGRPPCDSSICLCRIVGQADGNANGFHIAEVQRTRRFWKRRISAGDLTKVFREAYLS